MRVFILLRFRFFWGFWGVLFGKAVFLFFEEGRGGGVSLVLLSWLAIP